MRRGRMRRWLASSRLRTREWEAHRLVSRCATCEDQLMSAEGTIERPGGRIVAWCAWGDPEGRPLMLLHGTPGSRLDRSPDPTLFERIGACVVTFDRPGYGRSSVQPDRTVLSVADDAVAVADALRWDRFTVLGVSGGGPHALAVGHRAPERTRAIGLAVSAAPPDMIDPDDLIAVNREGRRRALEEGRAGLEEFLAEPAAQIAADPGAAIDSAMADAPLADREMLKRPDIRALLVESLREAFVNGPQGWFDDAWALQAPWGFELRDVSTPVQIWCGELDRNVPPKSIEHMAAELNLESLETIPGAGHLGWIAHEERIVRTLLG
jgi:pimeloyl-ACP methyl ester carboxylesterase